MENSETSKVLTRRGKKRVRVGRHTGGLRESSALMVAGSISFAWFRLFGLSHCPMPAHTPLSQDRF